jgi:hypothetical protein
MAWYDEELPNTYLSLDEGTHKIVFLNDEPQIVDGRDFNEKPCKKANFLVELNGQHRIWSVRVGSEKSVYGQLHDLAKKVGGLAGRVVVARVKGVNKDKSYFLELEVKEERVVNQ